jgi:hypothetical protein
MSIHISPDLSMRQQLKKDKNCMFQERNGTIWLQVVTKQIIPEEQLRGRYSQAYWCKIKWTLALQLTMREKYRVTTIKEAHIQKWKRIVNSRRNQDS